MNLSFQDLIVNKHTNNCGQSLTKRIKNSSPKTKSRLSLSVYLMSGKAYKVISRLFCLPTKSTLLKWISRIPNCPGFTTYAMDTISQKVNTLSTAGKQCVISFDEISFKTNLSYESNTDELVGLDDYGDSNRYDSLATSAIVFMSRA